jgi:hypothetical protein
LRPEERQALAAGYAEDVALLERLTGRDFSEWITGSGRGAFAQRRGTGGGLPESAR